MLGYAPRCVFMVFANPPADRVEELHHWYQVVHGPDAIANGSFNALRRYRCVSNPSAPMLALWEGEWTSDKEAWDYIAPRARELHDSGRIGDIPSADWASMTFSSDPPCKPLDVQPQRSMTMVQSDWYHPVRDQSLAEWAHETGLDGDQVGGPWHATGRGGTRAVVRGRDLRRERRPRRAGPGRRPAALLRRSARA